MFDKVVQQYQRGLLTQRELIEELTVIWNQEHGAEGHLCLGCAE